MVVHVTFLRRWSLQFSPELMFLSRQTPPPPSSSEGRRWQRLMCLQKRTWTNEMCPLVTTFPQRHTARLINAFPVFSAFRRSLWTPRILLTSSIKGQYFPRFFFSITNLLTHVLGLCGAAGQHQTLNSKQQHDTQQIPDYKNITNRQKNGLTKRFVAVTLLCVRNTEQILDVTWRQTESTDRRHQTRLCKRTECWRWTCRDDGKTGENGNRPARRLALLTGEATKS